MQSLQIFRTFERTKVIFTPMPHLITITLRTALGSLTECVRSAAGTRAIFAPATPILMTGGRLYDLALQFSENGSAGAKGTTPVADRPMMLSEEGE